MADEQLDALRKIIDELQSRVRRIETYWYVTLVVAAILGIDGAWIHTRLIALHTQSQSLLKEVDDAKATALSAIQIGGATAEKKLAQEAKAQVTEDAHTVLAARFLAGNTFLGSHNGHHGPWKDFTVQFKSRNGAQFDFAHVPNVVVVPDNEDKDAHYAWAATVMWVSRTAFGVRIKSVDTSHEGNAGWYGAAVQWIAYDPQ